MKTEVQFDLTPVDLYRIEAEARRLRADAFRNMIAGLGRRVSRLFAGRGAAGTRTA